MIILENKKVSELGGTMFSSFKIIGHPIVCEEVGYRIFGRNRLTVEVLFLFDFDA